MFKLSWKGVFSHKVRLALTALAIVLGVAFVSGSYVFTDSLKAAFDVLFEQETEVDLVVRAETEFDFSLELGTVPEDLQPTLLAVDGVEQAVPLIQSFAQIVVDKVDADTGEVTPEPIGGNGPPTFGFSWIDGIERVSALTIRNGRAPSTGAEVVIDAYSADANDLLVGSTVDVITAGGAEPFEIVGIVGFGDADNLLGATIAAFDIETAQDLFDLEGRYNQISLILEDGADRDAVQADIGALLPEGLEVITGEVEIQEGQEDVDEGVGFFNTALLVFAGIAVFVGAFIIQNTFRIIVTQRTRELAMLRAVGATGGQVTRMVVVEAFIVAFVASIIGILAGIGLAVSLKELFGALGFGFPEGPLTIEPRTIAIGLLVGIVVTVVSAVIPARRAARIPPIAAMHDLEASSPRSLRNRAFFGLAVLVVGVALLLFGLFGGGSNALAITGFGAAVTFLGVSVLAPLVAQWFGRTFGRPLPAVFGITGRLAQENAVRRPRRMASTASALMIGVALVSVIATLAASLKSTIIDAVGEEVVADFQIEARGFGDPTTTGVSPDLGDQLRELPEVGTLSAFTIGAWRDPVTEDEDFLMGVDPFLDEVVRLELSAGNFDDLDAGSVAVFTDFATDNDLSVGSTLDLEFPNGNIVNLDVVAIYGAELFNTNVMIAQDTYEANFTNRLERMEMLNVADGFDPVEARPTIEAVVAGFPNVEMNDAEEYVDKVAGQIDALLNVLTALLAMAIVIALLGITNTLALSIMERQREIGLLRAVGMTRRQVRRMIRWEAILIAVFGAIIGVVVGVGLGIAVVQAIGEGLRLTLPLSNLAIYVVAAAVGGVLASILPGRRGSRLDVLEAIAYQ